jgi:2-polyprenyl-3-methyl-5-hydroxy-6-metoxy-1,4-benzoquinol methylase
VFGNLKKRYGKDYFDYEISNQENFFTLMKLGLKDIEFDSLYQHDYNRRRFLDIGCATGLLLNCMKKKGWITQGVEICRASAGYAIEKFGVDVYIGTLEDASFPDQYFDVVHLSHLIEHVPDPKKLLLEVRRILRVGGHMVLTTPNVTGMQARVARKTWRSAIPEHIYLFSKKTMKTLLSYAGFTVVKQVSWGGIPEGKCADIIKKPADRFAKLFNIGDVMLFHCQPI